LLSSCAELTPVSSSNNLAELKKICIEGSGKGRIELVNTKQTFTYESQVDRVKNKFDLVLDFSLIGERQIEFSLNPEVTNREIKNSEIAKMLNEQLGERADKKRIVKAVEEFFVFISDFMRFKVANVFPKHFSSKIINGHFILERETPTYRFNVDNAQDNSQFFERLIFKIFIKGFSNDAILTLFLVPESCDEK
jgi:hypothetical protein